MFSLSVSFSAEEWKYAASHADVTTYGWERRVWSRQRGLLWFLGRPPGAVKRQKHIVVRRNSGHDSVSGLLCSSPPRCNAVRQALTGFHRKTKQRSCDGADEPWGGNKNIKPIINRSCISLQHQITTLDCWTVWVKGIQTPSFFSSFKSFKLCCPLVVLPRTAGHDKDVKLSRRDWSICI